MRFWDSSSIVPLLVEEGRSRACRALLRADRSMAVWEFTPVELASAIRRLQRNRHLDDVETHTALQRLGLLRAAWTTVAATQAVADRAMRVLALHPLAAADALQLAAAIEWVDDRPEGRVFITNDDRLGEAAARTGFEVKVPD